MHKNFSLALSLLAALAFVACGDDSSSATSDDSNSVNLDSSTDVIPGSDRESSSSINAQSSSSSINDDSEYDVAANTLTDLRDGQTYKTVTIGTQTWMAENLNYAYNEPTATEDSSSFCYSNAASNCAKYGRLYLWSAAMDSAAVFSDVGKGCGYGKECSSSGTVQGICPSGWHLPSFDEWNTLFTAVGGAETAGYMLKSTSGWSSNGNGTDAYGFSALPAGYRYNNGYFNDEGYGAYFWSSTENYSDFAYYMDLYYGSEDAYLDYDDKGNGLSVRCVKN